MLNYLPAAVACRLESNLLDSNEFSLMNSPRWQPLPRVGPAKCGNHDAWNADHHHQAGERRRNRDRQPTAQIPEPGRIPRMRQAGAETWAGGERGIVY